MPSFSLTQFEGLVTAPGLMSRNPASCIDVLNFEFPAPGVVRKRRGFITQGGNAGGPVWKLLTSRLMGNNVLAHVGTGSAGSQLRYGDGSVALTALTVVGSSALTRSASPRMQGAVCQRNYYVTADEGVARVESNIGLADVRFAGMPRGYPMSSGSVVAGSNIPAGFARAYRVTWHRLDADGIELGGAPTSRMVVANATYMGGAGVAAALRVEFQVPREWGTLNTALTTEYFWKLWGTRTYDELNQVGDDEMGLVAQRYVTGAEIAAGFVRYDDNTPDSYLDNAPRLHTNTNNFPPAEVGLLQGIVNSDAPPPLANDVAYWQDVMWYADTSFRRSITASFIALPADGDTVTVQTTAGSVTLTARNVPVAPTDFWRFTGGPTTAINLRETVRFFAAALNRNSVTGALGVAAYTTGTATQTSGLFFIELTRTQALLNVTSSNPAVIETYGGYQLNTNAGDDAMSNRLMWSKPLRADAVPPINQLTAGPKDGRVLRIFPLKDTLVVFADYGIYRVTGRTFADFAMSPLDLGYRLIGRELVAQCDEKLYAWCYEGIVEIDEGGVRVVSAPIEPTIENVILQAGNVNFTTGQSTLSSLGFATAYRQQHQVRFHYPQATDSLVNGCAQWLAFDTRTRAWTIGGFTEDNAYGFLENRSCAVVRLSDDRLAMGNWSAGADTLIFTERRAYAASDFIDDYSDGRRIGVSSRATMQYAVPQQQGAQHWQQFIISWDAEEQLWRPLPTLIGLTFQTEASVAIPGAITVSELLTRYETPLACRRGNRLRVTILHDISEYCGFVGLEQEFASGSRFGRRVAP